MLESLFCALRQSSQNQLLPSEICYLWEKFGEAAQNGIDVKEAARDLCLSIEAHYFHDEPVLKCDESKLMYAYGRIYDTSRCFKASKIYYHMYKNRKNPVHWKELAKLLGGSVRRDEIKKILNELPPELREHIQENGRGGRIYLKPTWPPRD